MLKLLQEFFADATSPGTDTPQHELELCAAVLMLEVAHADQNISETELHLIDRSLGLTFNLSDAERDRLLQMAQDSLKASVSLYEFTREINDAFSREQRTQLVELLWQVAMADEHLDRYEEYNIRKISDLLYVEHSDFIQAKLKVMESH